MILSCNSCEKKFVVPDNAIGKSGRLVQCSSCGNKWKQFPIVEKGKKTEKITPISPVTKKIKKNVTKSKRKVSKKSGPDLYSPEYLAKKHGLKINSESPTKKQKTVEKNITFGFYASLLVFVIFLVTILRTNHYFFIFKFLSKRLQKRVRRCNNYSIFISIYISRSKRINLIKYIN